MPRPLREARQGPQGLAPLAALGIVLAAAVLLQLPALEAPFFADDYLFLDQVGRGSLPATLVAPDPIGNFYRPVGRQLYFWLVARAGGGSARAFHAANLGLWLGVLALLFAVARHLAGARAGLIAASLLALHYAADVPLRWASGCQDLLAVAAALGAIWLHLGGRTLWAGLALLAALLSKEVVALTPLVAVVAARRPQESWLGAARRAWPLAAAVVAWALVVALATHGRAGAPERLTFGPAAAAAAFVHLLQVVPGLEWGSAAWNRVPPALPALAPLALVLIAIGTIGRRGARPARGPKPAGPGKAVTAGLVWALAGAAPVATVASIWSAYYYLFALCGAALALGSWLAPRGRGWAMAAVALIAWNSARSGALEEFALVNRPWNARSRINRYYLERGAGAAARYLTQLIAARPTLPPRSTLFFSGLPGGVAFQTADGPLVRWAYRDTSLRSYYLNSFDLAKAQRGPLFFFEILNDSLRGIPADPELFYRYALGAILSERPGAAREFLAVGRDPHAPSPMSSYWLAWVDWALGERERALDLLRAAGFGTDAGPAAQNAAASRALAKGDTAGALRVIQGGVEAHALDAQAHALLADLCLARNPGAAVLESYAARLLEPGSPPAWRRWALLQVQNQRTLEAAASLRRYFDLAGAEGERDAEAQEVARFLRRKYPSVARALDSPSVTDSLPARRSRAPR